METLLFSPLFSSAKGLPSLSRVRGQEGNSPSPVFSSSPCEAAALPLLPFYFFPHTCRSFSTPQYISILLLPFPLLLSLDAFYRQDLHSFPPPSPVDPRSVSLLSDRLMTNSVVCPLESLLFIPPFSPPPLLRDGASLPSLFPDI